MQIHTASFLIYGIWVIPRDFRARPEPSKSYFFRLFLDNECQDNDGENLRRNEVFFEV